MAANLLVATFGPGISVLNAFLFIGLDLTARDRLHEAWHGRHLLLKMGALIATGSIITVALNPAAGRIAAASVIAFAAAAIADTALYSMLWSRRFLIKANGSNVGAAAVDSLLFPWVAFGGILPWVTLGQFAAKTVGGFLWSLILRRDRSPSIRGIAVTETEIIARQARLLMEQADEIDALTKRVSDAQAIMVCIGGPLNDNKLGYTGEQLATFVRIQRALGG